MPQHRSKGLVVACLLKMHLFFPPYSALTALKLYDRVLRPYTQRIVESSREAGLILSGKGHETELDETKLRELLLPRWSFIMDYDNKAHCQEAIRMMDSELLEQKVRIS